MPLPNQLMTEREREIAGRVHHLRRAVIKWSQPDLAQELGLTQNQLASIEYQRAPLRPGPASHLCQRFDISQKWLAEGVPPIQPAYPVAANPTAEDSAKTLFSAHYDRFLRREIAGMEKIVIGLVGEANFRAQNFDSAVFASFPPPGSTPEQAAAHFVKKAVLLEFATLTGRPLLHYADTMLKAHEKFRARQKARPAPGSTPATGDYLATIMELYQAHTQVPLDNASPAAPAPVASAAPKIKMPKTVTELLALVKARARERGAKAALARHCGVSRQAVDQWLTGHAQPTAETTFKLLTWLEVI